MTSLSSLELALQRLLAVSTTYNSRSVEEFVDKARAEFQPRPASLDNELGYGEDETQQEGYTFEGALSKCVHMEALPGFVFERGPDPSAAEKAGQVYYKTPESLLDALPRLIEAPLSEAELAAHRIELLDDLSRQATENGITADFEIPEDWLEVLSVTRQVRGAGLPGYNHEWDVMTLPELGPARAFKDDEEYWLRAINKRLSLDVGLYWLFGREDRYIHVYYAFARPKGAQEFKWQILEYRDHQFSTFDTIVEYLNDTSARLERRLADGSLRKTVCFIGDFRDHW